MSFDVDKFKYLKIDATKRQINQLESLIEQRASETKIHNFINDNREVFSYALHGFQRGHHGTIVLSEQNIKPHVETSGESGLIPDFIVGGDSSGGYEWWVIEMKGADKSVFASDSGGNVYFSGVVNRAITQLLEYIDYCSENQSFLREVLNLHHFREPNGLIIVGTEEETSRDPRRRKLKGHWNRLQRRKLEIHSYNWILNFFKQDDREFDFDEE